MVRDEEVCIPGSSDAAVYAPLPRRPDSPHSAGRVVLAAAALGLLAACSPSAYVDGEMIRTCLGKSQYASLYRYNGRLYLANPDAATLIAPDADINQICPADPT